MKNGFTIIELVISIFVLSLGVVGIFSAFSVITILTSDLADRLTATYLAQEGMEIVRNIRDTNWLYMDSYCALRDCSAGNYYSWVDGIDGLDSCASGCEANYTTGSGIIGPLAMRTWPTPLKGNYLYINNTNGFYNYYTSTGDTRTKFKRKIIITCLNSAGDVDINCAGTDYIIKVKVEAAWDQKSSILSGGVSAGDALFDDCATYKNNCVITEETLYNWYNYVNH